MSAKPQWETAPQNLVLNRDIVEAVIEIDKDNCVFLYCERKHTAKVEAMLTQRKQLSDDYVQGLVGAAAVLIGSEFETDFFSAATKLVRLAEVAITKAEVP